MITIHGPPLAIETPLLNSQRVQNLIECHIFFQCAVNGINHGKLDQEGETVKVLEMFFSGFPKLIGMHFFPNLDKLVLMGQPLDKIEGLSFCPNLTELWVAECCLRVSLKTNVVGLRLRFTNALDLYFRFSEKLVGRSHVSVLLEVW